MKFKIDENLPAEVAQFLHEAGHDTRSVVEQNLGGRSDGEIANVCKKERRGIVTLDTGFADIRTYPPAEFAGIMVLRLKQQGKKEVLSILPRIIRALETNALDRQLWIVEEARIRIRGG